MAMNPTVDEETTIRNDQNQSQQGEDKTDPANQRKKWIIRGIVLLLIVVAIIVVVIEYDNVKEAFKKFLVWVQEHPVLGPFLLALIYIVAVVFFLPGSVLTIGSGVALKQAYNSTWRALLIGSLAVWIGASVGAFLSFLLGRYVFKEAVEKLSEKYPLIRAIDKAIYQEGLKLIILLRLCPLIPFNALNYMMGITDIKTAHYLVGFTGMIPGTVAYVFIGTTISDIADAASGTNNQGTLLLIMAIVGSILAFAGVVWVSIVAKRNLSKYIQQAEEEQEQNSSERLKQLTPENQNSNME